MQDDTHYVGEEAKPFTSQPTWEQCRAECRTTHNCNFWSFRSSSNRCHLMTDIKGGISRQNGSFSGTKECFGMNFFRKELLFLIQFSKQMTINSTAAALVRPSLFREDLVCRSCQRQNLNVNVKNTNDEYPECHRLLNVE